MKPDRPTVTVETAARVHFGMLDIGTTRGRRFGGIGSAVRPPTLRLSATIAHDVRVSADPAVVANGVDIGEAVAAAAGAAARVLRRYAVEEGVRIDLHQLLPAHHGLGSGTQLALATGRAVAQLFDLPADTIELARVVGRAHRSAIGTYVFAHGGFIVEGGRRPDVDRPAPLLVRYPVPAEWRCVLALPPGVAGVSGEAESAAIASLPRPAAGDSERVAHLVLMALLPALVDGDFAEFGAALTEIQSINGRWFAAAQGGLYAPGPSTALVQALRQWGATGVGQSSWGPAVYAVTPDPVASAALACRIRSAFPNTVVYDAEFSNSGAAVGSR